MAQVISTRRVTTASEFYSKQIFFALIFVLISLYHSPLSLITGVVLCFLTVRLMDFNSRIIRIILVLFILSALLITIYSIFGQFKLWLMPKVNPNQPIEFHPVLLKIHNYFYPPYSQGYREIYSLTSLISDYKKGLEYFTSANYIKIFRAALAHSWAFVWLGYASVRRSEVGDPTRKFQKQVKQYKPNFKRAEESRLNNLVKGVTLGVNMSKDGKTPVVLPHDVLSRHVCLVGTTGSGKTVTIYNFIINSLLHKKPLIFIDGKGDAGNIKKFNNICKEFGVTPRIITIDGTNGYNPFATGTPTELTDKVIGMFEWSEEHYKSNASAIVQLLIIFLQRENITVNLESILKYSDVNTLKKYVNERTVDEKGKKLVVEYADKSSSNDVLGDLLGDAVQEQPKKEAPQKPQITQESVEYADKLITSLTKNDSAFSGFLGRVSSIVEGDSRTMLTADNPLKLDEAIKNHEVVLFSLDSLRYQNQARSIGKLVINDIKTCVSSHQRRGGGAVSLIFDEFNVFASHEVIDVINKARSAGFEALLAFQSLSDIDKLQNGEGLRRQIIQNCNTLIAQLQNDPKDAEELAKVFGSYEKIVSSVQSSENEASGVENMRLEKDYIVSVEDIKSLGTGDAFIKSGTGIAKVKVLNN